MWTDYDKENPIKMQRNIINDFAGYIKHDDGSNFTTVDSVFEHKKSLDFIKRELSAADADNKTAIVVTHHAPSLQSVDPKYQKPPYNEYNCCFVTDLDPIIEHFQPLYWIHGHVHDYFNYNVGKTQIIANPFGYPHENGQNGHKPLLIAKIPGIIEEE